MSELKTAGAPWYSGRHVKPYSEWTEEEKERRNARRRENHAKRRAEQALAGLDRGDMFGALGEWVSKAECANRRLPPEWFEHPTEREPQPAPEHLLREQRYIAQACHACPVRDECLLEARTNDFSGTWGGVLRYGTQEHDLIRLHILKHRREAA